MFSKKEDSKQRPERRKDNQHRQTSPLTANTLHCPGNQKTKVCDRLPVLATLVCLSQAGSLVRLLPNS